MAMKEKIAVLALALLAALLFAAGLASAILILL